MVFKDTGEVKLYIRSMGKLLRVTAAFMSADKVNRHCASHRDQGVIAEIGENIFLANIYDTGLKIN